MDRTNMDRLIVAVAVPAVLATPMRTVFAADAAPQHSASAEELFEALEAHSDGDVKAATRTQRQATAQPSNAKATAPASRQANVERPEPDRGTANRAQAGSSTSKESTDTVAILAAAACHIEDPEVLRKVLTFQRKRLAALKRQRVEAEDQLRTLREHYVKRAAGLDAITNPSTKQCAIVQLEMELRSAEAALVSEVGCLGKRIALCEEREKASKKQLRTIASHKAVADAEDSTLDFRDLLEKRASEAQQYFESLRALLDAGESGKVGLPGRSE